MGQLMPEDPLEPFAVGTKDDGAALGLRDRRRPGGRAAAGEGVESACVGNHDEAEGIDGAEPKAGPLAGSGGLARQLGGELQLRGPGNRGHLPHLDHPGRLGRVRPDRAQAEQQDQDASVRGTSPPAATRSSISLHRLAQGLNLLAL